MKAMARKSRRENTGGFTLTTVLMVAMLAGALTAIIVSGSSSLPTIVRRQADAVRAKAIAEAGLNEAYSRLAEDFSLRHNPAAFPPAEFDGGSYAITVTPLSETVVRLASIGRYGVATVQVGMDIRNAGTTAQATENPLNPWRFAIFSNGNLRLNGTPPAVRGAMHTNQDFRLSGNPSNIEGTVTARSFTWTGGQLPPSQIGTFYEIPFPQLTDPYFVELLALARKNGAVRGSGTYRQQDLEQITGGVAWFNGNVTFHGSFNFNGVIVVTGSITFQGSGTRTVNGLLYTPGNITANGVTTLYLTGSMMAGGNIEFNGASSIFTHGTVGPDPGADPGVGEDVIVVSAWWE